MKWLKRRHYENGVLDPESQAAWASYASHLTNIYEWLEDGSEELVTDIHLEGAIVESYSYKDATLELVVLNSTSNHEYRRTKIVYYELQAMEPMSTELDFLVQRPTELICDEVEVYQGRIYEHRILCWPKHELMVRFRRVEVSHTSATEEERQALS